MMPEPEGGVKVRHAVPTLGSCPRMPAMMDRRGLDHVVLDVELVLISVVQGVALSMLASST